MFFMFFNKNKVLTELTYLAAAKALALALA